MEDPDRDKTSLVKGARDIAKEAKRHAVKKVNKVVDHASNEYSSRSYSRFENDEDEGGDEDRYYYQDGQAQREDDEGSSDATEGHDDEDEIYEGEYQGVPAGDGVMDGRGQPPADGMKDKRELEKEREADEEELAQQYELIIQECGHGRFQWQLFFVCFPVPVFRIPMFGVVRLAPVVARAGFRRDFLTDRGNYRRFSELKSVGEREREKRKHTGSVVYLGMMVGAFFWGGLSDKVGRRQCLLVCMSVNGFFAFLSSFVQGYGTFLFCRMLSGFGIGGAVPIVFSYFAEFLSREKRGEHLSWLCMFWMVGGIYASAMAWAIIPHYGGSGVWPNGSAAMTPSLQEHGERQVGKHDEAWMVLKQIHDTNMRARGEPEKVFTVNRIKIPKQLDELVEMQSESANPAAKVLFRIKSELRGIWLTFLKCWDYPVKDNTVKLALVWFSLSFGYYGLSVWFPDVIKHLQADEYASRVKIHNNERIEDFTFNFTLENQIHKNGVFINDRFIGMKFKSVTFIDSTFQSCYFEDISSIGSFFKNCTIIEAFFYNTDIDDSKFIGSSVINSTFAHNKTGCQMTFDDDYSAYWVYFINFLGTLAVLPGNIVSALLMDKVGRLSMLGGSMVLSGISCFFLWFGTSESMMIAMLCLYNGLSISAWNSLDVVTAELYPTNRRGTGFGFCNAMCKLAAVLGNVIFGSLVGITKSIPILLASSVLVAGGLVGLRLPDTRNNVLM
ncbi:synaptic vesicle glycoprotein 2C-like [Sinocyclocheilus rhinocerous]|uniref:synaptic vesicle glycoprotein 2C-like n=1 Tax=Sinocyclocheilus rhinocerous TaxID=307959 RepID=UPI0007B95A76|nr:PREDICTED: synaptic vesicle glycoprotein 2C-like [Sinocyclocheilus rhinocerous]